MLVIFTKNFTQLVARKIVVSIGQALGIPVVGWYFRAENLWKM
jgi:hypothetical protein